MKTNEISAEQLSGLPDNGKAHVKGNTSFELVGLTVSGLLDTTAKKWPTRAAVVFREQGIRCTWQEFAQQVDAAAAGLHVLGLRAGDRIGIWSPNRVEWLITQFATARLGLVLVNINPANRRSELEYVLGKVGCKAIITAEFFKSSHYVEILREVVPELSVNEPGDLQAQRLPTLQWVICLGRPKVRGILSFETMSAGGADLSMSDLDAITASLNAHDAINIQFTSGTTGAPKGATLTHYNIVNNARSIAAAMNLTQEDKLCIPVPLYHCFGMVLAVLACVSSGACMVFPGEAFDPLATMEAVEQERCTALHGVPTMFIAQLEHPTFNCHDFSSLRTGIMAGAPCPIEVMRRVVSDMNMKEITIAYGMTETSPVSFQSATDDPLERRVSTVGRVLPHLECKIVDAQGLTVAVGQAGEICTRGYSVMQGYWDDEKRTQEVIREGWMHTGDLAVIDAEGYCTIVGRVKDMVIRGGENVYPREIEEYLFTHPKVQSVQVFGVPDARFGEELCAWIILKQEQSTTEEEIREFCRGRIAHYKVPRYVRFVAAMPLTATGKVQKFAMRDQMIRELTHRDTLVA